MSEDLLEWARKNHENWLFRAITAEAGINLPEQGEKIDMPPLPEPAPNQGDLTEVCQLFGKALYVRLDWRYPDTAKYELERIHSTLVDAFRYTGIMPERSKDQEAYRDANTKAGEQ